MKKAKNKAMNMATNGAYNEAKDCCNMTEDCCNTTNASEMDEMTDCDGCGCGGKKCHK